MKLELNIDADAPRAREGFCSLEEEAVRLVLSAKEPERLLNGEAVIASDKFKTQS